MFCRRVVSSFSHTPLKYGSHTWNKHATYAIWTGRALDRSRPLLRNRQNLRAHQRNYGMFVVRALRGVLKIRYLLLGGAVGGTVTLQKVLSHTGIIF